MNVKFSIPVSATDVDNVNHLKSFGPPTAICLTFVLLSLTCPFAHAPVGEWSGGVGAPAKWQLVESWSGKVNPSWELIDTWSGTAKAPVFWSSLESWSGATPAPAPEWQLVETRTSTIEAPIHNWQKVEVWSGSTSPEPPKAEFTYKPAGPIVYELVKFQATGDNRIDNYLWEFGDGESGTGVKVTHPYDKPDNYGVRLTVVYGEGSTDSEDNLVTVQPIPEKYIESQSTHENVTLDNKASMEIEMKNVEIQKLEITVKVWIEDAGIKVQQLQNVPRQLEAPPGIIYKAFNFEIENFVNENVKVVFDFRVKKDWLSSKNVNEDSVRMYRYNADLGDWIELETKKVDEDEDSKYFYYSSTSSKFSLFAVSGTKEEGLPWGLICGIIAACIVGGIGATTFFGKWGKESTPEEIAKEEAEVERKTEVEREGREVSGLIEERMNLVEEFLGSDMDVAKVSGAQSADEIHSSLERAVGRLGEEDSVEVLLKDGEVYLRKK